jgi:hypothetical protein
MMMTTLLAVWKINLMRGQLSIIILKNALLLCFKNILNFIYLFFKLIFNIFRYLMCWY